MKRLILFMSLAVLYIPLYAAERPAIAVLPFGEAKDRNQVEYLGLATASTLTEKLRRVPSVRVIPISSIIHELRAAGIEAARAVDIHTGKPEFALAHTWQGALLALDLRASRETSDICAVRKC